MQKQLNELSNSYKQSNKTIQKNQTNLKLEIEEADINLQILEEKLEEGKTDISKVSQRLDDLRIKVAQLEQHLLDKQTAIEKNTDTVDYGSKQILKPTDLYQIAYTDYISQNYDLSMVGFKEYLKKILS